VIEADVKLYEEFNHHLINCLFLSYWQHRIRTFVKRRNISTLRLPPDLYTRMGVERVLHYCWPIFSDRTGFLVQFSSDGYS